MLYVAFCFNPLSVYSIREISLIAGKGASDAVVFVDDVLVLASDVFVLFADELLHAQKNKKHAEKKGTKNNFKRCIILFFEMIKNGLFFCIRLKG